MRIVFFPSGICHNKDGKLIAYGRGHVFRCLNLAKCLKNENSLIEIIFAASGNEYYLSKKSEFQAYKLPLVGVSSSVQHSVNKTKFEINLLRFLKPDVIVSDNHKEAILAAKYLGIPSVAICDLPPIMLFPIYAVLADLILIPQLAEILKIPDYLLEVNEKVNVVGPILNEDCFDQEEILRKASLSKDKQKMIVAYASRPVAERIQYLNLLFNAYKMIKEIKPNTKLLVIGPGLTQEKGIESLPGVKILDFVPSLPKSISKSEIFITRAPVSAMEAIALGIPTIIIPISGDIHQKIISKELEDLGVLCYLNFQKSTPQFLKEKIDILLSGEAARNEMINKGRSLLSVSSGKISAELILNLLKR